MCGRFAASAGADEYVELFGVQEVVDEPVPSYNLAPTDRVPAVVERLHADSGEVIRKLVTPRWGLVPSWSTNAAGAARLINARAETVATKPAFRKAFAARRCLIGADGYYEWVALPPEPGSTRPRKQPYFLHPAAGGPFAMAGLYEFWRDPAGEWLTTCTIITTTATDALGHLHDRMPMTVPREAWASWLDPRETRPELAASLLVAPDGLVAHAVSTRVNSVANDGPDLIEPCGEEPTA